MRNRQLLFSVTKKDLEITYFSGTGAGGQYRNKHQNCCRIKHIDSGVIVTAQEQRSKDQNLKVAFKRLCENKMFKYWLNKKIYELSEQYKKDQEIIKQKVEEAIKPENLKIEFFDLKEKNKI